MTKYLIGWTIIAILICLLCLWVSKGYELKTDMLVNGCNINPQTLGGIKAVYK